MQYMVKGADGKEYGPTDLSTLRTWAAEGRLAPHSNLRDFNTGQTLAASAVPGLFESAAGPGAPPIPTGYPRSTYPPATSVKDPGTGMFIGVVLRSVGAVVLFFLFHGIGVFFAAYAMVYAVQCQQRGSKYGIPALVIAGIALAAVGIGWAMRLTGTGV